MRVYPILAGMIVATLAGAPLRAAAQTEASAVPAAPAACASVARPAVPPEPQRRAAREIAARAQEAAITDDAARSRDLYRQSAQLDPSDAGVAYALGRAYETARDDRATGEYCRFLALAPNAPEAPDVRQRLMTLSARAIAASTARPVTDGAASQPASPGGAFATGLILPGGGQYATHRPAVGLLVTLATGGALLYAFQSQTVRDSTLRNATDPNGKPYQFYVSAVRSERSHLGVGVAAAAGISLIAAIEAYSHARGEQRDARQARASRDDTHTITPIVADLGSGIGVGLRLAVGGL
ncbi:MAG TPA: hypothetical protein VGT98_15160 [Candidatus Elarobacter sp.]|nr:hypothetical protein [Candidatus Elarobacter sp.]